MDTPQRHDITSYSTEAALPDHLQPPAPGSAAAKILAAARSLFAERGLAATSTRSIAQQAGVNLALIHYYFGNKEQLYRRVVAQEVIDLRRLVTQVFEQQTTPAETLPQLPRVALRLHREHPQLMRLLLREIADGAPYLSAIIADLGAFGPHGVRDLMLSRLQADAAAVPTNLGEPTHLLAILFSVGNGLHAFAPLLKEVFGVDMSDETTSTAVLDTVTRVFRLALTPDKED